MTGSTSKQHVFEINRRCTYCGRFKSVRTLKMDCDKRPDEPDAPVPVGVGSGPKNPPMKGSNAQRRT